MLKVYGSNTCPDTLHALVTLRNHNVDITFVNVTGTIGELKNFLYMRDTDAVYEGIQGSKRIGFPLFEREDGSKTLDFNAILKEYAK